MLGRLRFFRKRFKREIKNILKNIFIDCRTRFDLFETYLKYDYSVKKPHQLRSLRPPHRTLFTPRKVIRAVSLFSILFTTRIRFIGKHLGASTRMKTVRTKWSCAKRGAYLPWVLVENAILVAERYRNRCKSRLPLQHLEDDQR